MNGIKKLIQKIKNLKKKPATPKPIKPQGLKLDYTVVDEATAFSKETLKALNKILKKQVWVKVKPNSLKVNPKALKLLKEKLKIKKLKKEKAKKLKKDSYGN